MKRFCSESISEGDKLTIRSYRTTFVLKCHPLTLNYLNVDSLYQIYAVYVRGNPHRNWLDY